jgi:hypothetical protein
MPILHNWGPNAIKGCVHIAYMVQNLERMTIIKTSVNRDALEGDVNLNYSPGWSLSSQFLGTTEPRAGS